jgi:hypothetical protein
MPPILNHLVVHFVGSPLSLSHPMGEGWGEGSVPINPPIH